MSRPLRFIPGKKILVEVTTRTVHSRLLLRPSNELNEVVLGILGRAQELYDVQISAYVFLSNHFHIFLIVDSAPYFGGLASAGFSAKIAATRKT